MAKVCDITLTPNPTHELSLVLNVSTEDQHVVKTLDLSKDAYLAIVSGDWAQVARLTHPSIRVKDKAKSEGAKKANKTREANKAAKAATPAPEAPAEG